MSLLKQLSISLENCYHVGPWIPASKHLASGEDQTVLDVNQTMSVEVRGTMTQALEVLDRFDRHLLSIYYELHIKELKTAYVLVCKKLIFQGYQNLLMVYGMWMHFFICFLL